MSDGDELRHINWKASTRTDRLLTNEYQTERSGDVVIIVDGRSADPGQPSSSKLMDACVEAAASVSAHLLRQRNRVGMIILGEFIEVVKLAPGHRQFLRINDALLNAKVGEVRSLQGSEHDAGTLLPSDRDAPHGQPAGGLRECSTRWRCCSSGSRR